MNAWKGHKKEKGQIRIQNLEKNLRRNSAQKGFQPLNLEQMLGVLEIMQKDSWTGPWPADILRRNMEEIMQKIKKTMELVGRGQIIHPIQVERHL